MADSSGGIPSNLTGTTPPGYTPAYGGAPVIPDPIASMWQALGGDAAAMPSLTSLADIYNLFNYNQQKSQVAGTPGFSNVNDLLNAKLPQDVQNNIAQSAAERGIQTGTYGSPNSDAALLRAMGMSSLDAQKLGQDEYGNLLSHFPKAAPFDMSSMFVSPEQQQSANAAANVSAAAPNPKAAADEEFRKLLEAIAAGKAGAGVAPGVAPGLANLTGLLNPNGTPAGPGTMVGSGPANTTTQPNLWTPSAPTTLPPTAPGTPQDAIQRAASSWNLGGTSSTVPSFNSTVFGSPGYQNSGILGGLGLDPILNAIFGTAPTGWNSDPSMVAGIGSGWNLGSTSNDMYYTGQNTSTFADTAFGSPSYQDSNILGFGLDPTLNSLFGPSQGGMGSYIPINWWEDPQAIQDLYGDENSGWWDYGAGDYGEQDWGGWDLGAGDYWDDGYWDYYGG